MAISNPHWHAFRQWEDTTGMLTQTDDNLVRILAPLSQWWDLLGLPWGLFGLSAAFQTHHFRCQFVSRGYFRRYRLSLASSQHIMDKNARVEHIRNTSRLYLNVKPNSISINIFIPITKIRRLFSERPTPLQELRRLRPIPQVLPSGPPSSHTSSSFHFFGQATTSILSSNLRPSALRIVGCSVLQCIYGILGMTRCNTGNRVESKGDFGATSRSIERQAKERRMRDAKVKSMLKS
jgi:hypothetical protein